jgi:hypothetical protein
MDYSKYELHNLYYSPNTKRMIKWLGHVACTGEIRNVYKIPVRKSEGKRQFARPWHRWEANIKVDLNETV